MAIRAVTGSCFMKAGLVLSSRKSATYAFSGTTGFFQPVEINYTLLLL